MMRHFLAILSFVVFVNPNAVSAQESAAAEELAKQLSNPIADLASLPFQLNYDENIGADDSGSRWTLNVQPVIPFRLSEDWNLISRTIVPIISTDGIPTGSGTESGLGDTVQSFFFSPAAATSSGWTWGVGPVLLLPTSTDSRFGVGEWERGAGSGERRSEGGDGTPRWEVCRCNIRIGFSALFATFSNGKFIVVLVFQRLMG